MLTDGRVCLRRFNARDAPVVHKLAGAAAVADTTLNIPHPYPPGAAETWIARHDAGFEAGTEVVFAVTVENGGAVVGAIGIRVDRAHGHGEIGYWIGQPFWGCGYATAALRLMSAYCFSVLNLHRMYAHHMARNPASGRVMQKASFQREGTLRGHIAKAGRYEDIVIYALLMNDSNRES